MRDNALPYHNTKRPIIMAMFSGPGPACVGRLGLDNGPKYSFGLKPGQRVDAFTPGPAAYTVHDKSTRFGSDGSPKYTLHSRTKQGNSFTTPGPAAYSTEKVKIFKQPTPPSYSFGSRTRFNKRDGSPAPNAYTVPPIFGSKTPTKRSAPAYVMTGRGRVGGFSEDLSKTPGPGTYKVNDPNSWKHRAPSYSISGRFMMPGDSTQKPGPAHYSPHKQRSGTGPSFGVRHSEYTAPVLFSTC
eukprot:TCONS_00027313-protein